MNKALLLLGASLLAGGCTTNDNLRQADLDRIAEWLPGTYDNREQVDADLAKMALEASGIDSMFRTDGVSQIYSFPFFREIALIVRSNDADDAKKTLSLDLHEKEF